MLNTMLLLQALSASQRLGGSVPSSKAPSPESPALSDLLALLALLGAQESKPKSKRLSPEQRERRELRKLTLLEWIEGHYLPERNHAPQSGTACIARDTAARLNTALGAAVRIGEVTPGTVDRFRTWLLGRVADKRISPATANIHLRQLRAVLNHAAQKRIIKKLPAIAMLPEQRLPVEAWTLDDLAKLEARARSLPGALPGSSPAIPAALFWTAWLGVFRIGCRLTALMLSERTDFCRSEGTLLLRSETQKQKRDQRIVLPPHSVDAVAALLAASNHARIFGSWPYDPQRVAGSPRKWHVLTRHFRQVLLEPCGLKLPRGVKTRQFRRTVATLVDAAGGNAQQLLGHSSPKITELYQDRRRKPACREALLLGEPSPHRKLFE